MSTCTRLIAFLAVIGLTASTALAQETVTGKPILTDADTFVIGNTKFRLQGIDAPEMAQICFATSQPFACGVVARTHMSRIINGREVTCDIHGEDSYGRKLGTCRAGNTNLAEQLIAQGWALAYRQYSTAYVSAEEEAQSEGRGLWDDSVVFTAPWTWRQINE